MPFFMLKLFFKGGFCMSFEKINKKLGFGCMRLKMDGDKVDYSEFNKMIDMFMEAGFNYFDTAHGYIGGLSETSIRDCLSARYPRESFVLTEPLMTFPTARRPRKSEYERSDTSIWNGS